MKLSCQEEAIKLSESTRHKDWSKRIWLSAVSLNQDKAQACQDKAFATNHTRGKVVAFLLHKKMYPGKG